MFHWHVWLAAGEAGFFQEHGNGSTLGSADVGIHAGFMGYDATNLFEINPHFGTKQVGTLTAGGVGGWGCLG